MVLSFAGIGAFLVDNEASLRSSLFYAPLIIFAILEEFLPRRIVQLPMKLRWGANFGLMLLNLLLQRFLLPVSAVALAVSLQAMHIGLFNAYAVQGGYGLLLGVAILDCSGYVLHRLFHAVPFLWRLHRVHHSDVDFDVSTSVRHHPLEFVVTILFDLGVVVLFGLPPAAIILSATIAPAVDFFNHSNIRIPGWMDRAVRCLLVTPDMHRIHHSSYQPETDSNFSSLFSCWDRLFRSYRPQPRVEYAGMSLGLERWRGMGEQSLLRLLVNPFSS